MNIAITLVIQGVRVFLRRLAVMKFIWPSFSEASTTRQKKIADGSGGGQQEPEGLDEAEARSKEIMREARERAAQIVDQAASARTRSIEEAKGTALAEAQRLIAQCARGSHSRNHARPRGLAARSGRARRRRRVATAGARDRSADARRAARQARRPRSRVAERATIARPYAKAAFETARGAQPSPHGLQGLRCRRDRGRSAGGGAHQESGSADRRHRRVHHRRRRATSSMRTCRTSCACSPRITGCCCCRRFSRTIEVMRADVENTVDVEVISAVKLDPAQADEARGGPQHAAQAPRAHAQQRRCLAPGRRGHSCRRSGDRRVSQGPPAALANRTD